MQSPKPTPHRTRPPEAISFGETLFDRFEDGDYLGGAPLNVAWYLDQMGIPVGFVSAVGRDELGTAALRALERTGIYTRWVCRRPEPTGTVDISLSDGQPSYVFASNVAWDHISLEDRQLPATRLVYYGTLAQRSEASRATLGRLFESPFEHRFFDVNLRQGFYSDRIILDSLTRASIAKMNDSEWSVVARVADVATPGQLIERFDLRAAIVTLGSRGAELHTAAGTRSARPVAISVADAVGAGDAFSAVVAAAALRDVELESALPAACEAGAFVAAHRGAQVDLPADLRTVFDQGN